MSKPTYDEASNAYRDVLGHDINLQDVNYIIQILAGVSEVDKDYFKERALDLDVMSIGEGDVAIIRKYGKRANTAKYVTSGASGIIYSGESGIIYKKINIDIFEKNDSNKYTKTRRDPEVIEEEIKEAFLEAWFQTVLSLDKSYGINIGKITRFFRDPSLKKVPGGINWWETKMNSATFYITMEFIPNNFEKMLIKTSPEGEKATVESIKPQLSKLAEVLIYFDENYGFRHRDLHSGNVMFTDETMDIKLIDFGRCCMNFEWSPDSNALYSMSKWGADDIPQELIEKGSDSQCFSLDLFIYLISILQDPDYEKRMSYSLHKMFNAMVTSSPDTGSQNLFYYLKSVADGKVKSLKKPYSPFWDSYPWSFADWDKPHIVALADTQTVFLTGFKEYVDRATNADYPEPERGAVSATSRPRGKARHGGQYRTHKGGYKKSRQTRRKRPVYV